LEVQETEFLITENNLPTLTQTFRGADDKVFSRGSRFNAFIGFSLIDATNLKNEARLKLTFEVISNTR